MNSQQLLPALALPLFLFAAGCAENPADKVPAADVSHASTETTTSPVEPSSSVAGSATYLFTSESKIEFTGSKVTGSHSGGFTTFSGSFVVEGDKPGAGPHRIEIDMNSTWSDDDRLTGHLKSPDFFDVENFPTSVFQLNSVTPAGEGNAYTLSGDFTLHGVTKQISFPATIAKPEEGKMLLNAEFSINRKDFAIVYPGKPDDLIREEVVIRLAMVAAEA